MGPEAMFRKTVFRAIPGHDACLFCNSREMEPRVLIDMNYWFMILDDSPVNKGHALIILKRHYPDIFNLSRAEWIELEEIIERAKEYLDDEFHPDGYNLGVNCGEAAGQTIFHLHIHLIPRYKDDVENPRGGIRNFKKALVAYA
ncbi:MAG: HIT family protein [Patescibacteria group bacterium]